MSGLVESGALTWLAQALKKESGYVLSPDKAYLVESRLRPIAQARQSGTVQRMLEDLRRSGDPGLFAEVVEAMTIQETSFFRDGSPFATFERDILPAIIASTPSSRPLRIWCAAASTGQEPYSLAIVCRENSVRLAGRSVEILASDISRQALLRARQGIYTDAEVSRGLPEDMRRRYFQRIAGGWQIDPTIRQMVTFRQINLVGEYGMIGPFDLVMCRNVLIYFDEAMKRTILERIARCMNPDGYLILGAAESVIGLTRRLSPAKGIRAVYKRCDPPVQAA